MKKLLFYGSLMSITLMTIACQDDNNNENSSESENKPKVLSEEYYAGGELGTVFNASSSAYEQPTPACDNAKFSYYFKKGETLFERDFNQTEGSAFYGLGPVYVRKGCLYCHPGYGHGKRQSEYRESTMGNGYLLVIYDKLTNAYIRSVAGMPQTGAIAPFKAPIDEKQIIIDWKQYTDEWGNRFEDGETYDLIYPEVSIPYQAFYSPVIVNRSGQNVEITESEYAENIGVLLESTIGIYGTGITDAIPDSAITNEWKRQSEYFNSIGKSDALNPSLWSQSDNDWVSYYSGRTGTKYVRRYTYAMSRGPILDAAGANAIWNITNVTRSDRPYHYLDLNFNAKAQTLSYYAQTSSKDPEVQRDFYTYYPDENKTGDVEKDIYNYLTSNTLEAEMSDNDYRSVMVWHRGLAVPAARDLDNEDVKRGKQLFSQIGCATCHRPSWTTGDDIIQDPNGLFGGDDMPRYPHQKIWPYTDFVQHRLHMVNDIRTGWCRTTPLWGRGLSKLCTGADDRLHDCRARTVIEAIMWHGAKDSDARRSTEAFRKLSKSERDAMVKFINAI